MQLRFLALTSYLLLLAISLLWEGWFAPVRTVPPGVWLMVKCLPLLLPLRGLLHDRSRSYMLASLLLLLYLIEGVVLAVTGSGHPPTLIFALGETLLTLTFIASAGLRIRQLNQSPD